MRIPYGIINSCQFPGISYLLKKQRRGAIILFYHGIEYRIIDKRIQTIHIPFDLYEKQIHYLRNNFDIISLDYLQESLREGYKISPSQVAITFDDGYKNNLHIVAPFLKTYNIPFTVFICTNHIESGKRFPAYYLHASINYTEMKFIELKSINQRFDISTPEKKLTVQKSLLRLLKSKPQHEVNKIVDALINLIPQERWVELNNRFYSDEPLDWDDVKKLYRQGVTIGSHCHDHAILHSHQDKEEIEYQLKTSNKLIESHLGECRYFSYPNGGINDITLYSINSVKNNKYLLGCTTILGQIESNCNPYILPRIGGEKDMEIFKFDLDVRLRYKNTNKWATQFNNLRS